MGGEPSSRKTPLENVGNARGSNQVCDDVRTMSASTAALNSHVTDHEIVSRVTQSLQCLATGWTTGRSRFDPRQRRKDFSCSLCVQTGCGAHPTSCTMGTGGSFPGGKAWPVRDADHSLPSSAEVEKE
jgi:hypothetical protein